ncbi:ABC transporter permease [Acidaminobacter sp. JC074]|uniref:ABC transporter permease n=1 Tax=Acidaminobacter sp. JC074 TaxID=2530199 RepID=UPI001F0E1717|nr:ABC transporter permease [Acidaminobacter sp. JC074]MCH4887981.1 ABC transporter permease [Acidaminobacter sp. JC074]
MKRILSIAIRDFKSSVRDFIALYIMVSPIVLAFLIASFVPATESGMMTLAVDKSVTQETLSYVSPYAHVEVFDNRQDLEDRVNALDDVIGLVEDHGTYEILKEGNEQDDSSTLIINLIRKGISEKTGQFELKSEISFSDIGAEVSPVALIGLISMAVLALVLGGMVVSMNIIEEKENMTFGALNATPLSRFEFIVGKSLAGSIIAVIQIIAMYFIFGFGHVDLLQVLFISIMGLSIVIIMGFILGLVSPSQMAALANMKILFLPISITIIGALMIPTSKHFVLWWSPFYWIYDGMTNIVNETATWPGLLIDGLGVTVITFIIFLIFRKKISSNMQTS